MPVQTGYVGIAVVVLYCGRKQANGPVAVAVIFVKQASNTVVAAILSDMHRLAVGYSIKLYLVFKGSKHTVAYFAELAGYLCRAKQLGWQAAFSGRNGLSCLQHRRLWSATDTARVDQSSWRARIAYTAASGVCPR